MLYSSSLDANHPYVCLSASRTLPNPARNIDPYIASARYTLDADSIALVSR